MGWTDKISGAWDTLQDVTHKANDFASFSKIGAAYTAVGDTVVGDAIGFVAKPVIHGFEDTASALTWPLDKVKRGLATGDLMSDRHRGVSLFDGDAWAEAWKRSDDISLGQDVVTGIRDEFNIGGQGKDNFSSGEFLAPDNDPYTGKKAAEAHDFYTGSWQGIVASGAVDMIADFTLDPLQVAGVASKTAKIARETIKPGEAAGALAQALGGSGNTAREVTQGNKLRELFVKTDGLNAGQMATLPEFRATKDAGAIAHFFQSANDLFPGEDAASVLSRHQAKADIFGAVLGDSQSIQAIKDTSAELAEQVRLMGTPPIQAQAIARYDGTDFGAKMLDSFNAGDPNLVGKLTEEHYNEMDRLERVLTIAGSSGKVASGPLERISAAGRMEKVSTATADRLSESYIPNGLGGLPMRMVVGNVSTRVPGAINIKDTTQGYEDLSSVVGAMRHTPSAARQQLMTDWVKAATPGDRREVVDAAEAMMFKDAAKKYGITDKAAKAFLDQAKGRRGAYNQALSDRLYSAAPEDRLIMLVDPEDGMKHAFQTAFLRTHIEDKHMVTDPRVIDQFLKRGTNRRLLERWAEGGPGPIKSAAHGVEVMGSATRDTLDNWMTMSTRLWKDAALMRLAYPVRIQVDSQLRTMAHIGMMKWFLDGKATGMARYIASGGDYEKALAKPLMKGGEYKGVPLAPAQDLEDVQKVVSALESHGGAMANIGNDITAATLRAQRKDGSYGKVKPSHPLWFESWKRAVDQVRTSPTAREALANDDIDSLKAWVLKDRAAFAEWNNYKKSHPDIESWLAKVITNNNHLLPTPELRERIANPESAKELFGIGSAQARAAALPGLKETRDSAEAKVKDLTSRIEQAKQELFAQNTQLGESHKTNPRIRDLQAQRKQARAERWQARAEHGDAKKGVSPGDVGDDGLVEPMVVHGESFSPLSKNTWGEKWESFRQGWYKWAADAPETIMARSPIYTDSFKRYIRETVDRLGPDGIDLVGADRIRAAADRAARKEVSEVLFDATHTSNLAHSMRFISPFFAAYEDTMKKWSKLMANDPQLAPNFAKIWQAPSQAGLVVDADGNKLEAGDHSDNGAYIIIPKIPGIERVIPGSRGSKGKDAGMFKIRQDSLNILFQGEPPWLPGNGPLVQIPANELVRRHMVKSGDNPLIKYLLPFGTTDDSPQRQLLPSWMKQVVDSGVGPFGTTKDFNQQYTLLYNQEYGAYLRGERKSEPDDEEIGNKTRMWFILRAGLNFTSPVSIQPVPKDQFYIDKAREYRADPKRAGHWQEDFYDDFPGYFEMSASLSVNETGLQSTNSAYDASQKYKPQIRKNPELGWYFAGPDNLSGEFNPDVNTYQRSTVAGQGKNYRSLKDPAQAIKDVQAEKGWIEYNKAATYIDLELQKRGLSNIQQKGAEDLQALKSTYTDYIKSQNSAFAEAFGPGQAEQRRETLVRVARETWKEKPEFAKRSDQVILKEYLEARTQMQTMLAKRPDSTLSASKNQDLAALFHAYTANLRRQSPAFEQIFNRTFESDDLSQVL